MHIFRPALLVILAAVTACAWIEKVDPTLPASSPTWVHCEDMNGNDNGMVCPQGQTCGGGKYSVGCPSGACCEIGNVGVKAPQSALDAGTP